MKKQKKTQTSQKNLEDWRSQSTRAALVLLVSNRFWYNQETLPKTKETKQTNTHIFKNAVKHNETDQKKQKNQTSQKNLEA